MRKVLVIEDDRVIREMLRLILEFNKYKVFVSEKAKDVLNIVHQKKIDVILLDHFLFGISGIEVCKELKGNESTSRIPILMMSALPEVEENCLQAGASAFLEKPFEKNILLSKIEKILNSALA
ncbi:response regulator [Christiangramia forsetii]|uniref:Protein containing response regulator receiver domain n=2 Tax=Christiangramia forsetii TaxID=411153 RepID=A0M211_CHRFK|nr:response regulator [Christiangramia forsetii]GGG44813.1 hypothetical protein GCM10011532_31020 [Christiangramia forsetii]CAL66656.1 protein containing response regulator receiver domain [Christiangramia forsetii KT0803]